MMIDGEPLRLDSAMINRVVNLSKHMKTIGSEDVAGDTGEGIVMVLDKTVRKDIVMHAADDKIMANQRNTMHLSEWSDEQVTTLVEKIVKPNVETWARETSASEENIWDGMSIAACMDRRAANMDLGVESVVARVVAIGLTARYKVYIAFVHPSEPIKKGVRFITQHESRKAQCYTTIALYDKLWLRPTFHAGQCVSCVKPMLVRDIPPVTLGASDQALRNVQLRNSNGYYGYSRTFWLACSPRGDRLSSFSLESFRDMCSDAEEGGSWQILLDTLHGHPVTGGCVKSVFGNSVSVVTKGQWKMARVFIGDTPKLPIMASMVSMRIRKHKIAADATHTWVFAKQAPMSSVHHLCFHVQNSTGKVETRCLAKPESMLRLAFPERAQEVPEVDIAGMLQVYKPPSESDAMWDVSVFLPEETGAIVFAE